MQTPFPQEHTAVADRHGPSGVRRPAPACFVTALTLSALFILLVDARTQAAAQGVEPPTVAAAAHFLNQATFGASAAEIEAVRSKGFQQWLLEQAALPESPIPDGLNTSGLRAAVFKNMATGSDQVRQRAVFALSQIFVVSANKVGSGPELTPWLRLLSRNALGNYHTLLREVTLNPTMGKYLDLAYSRKASSTGPRTRITRGRCCSCSLSGCGSSIRMAR